MIRINRILLITAVQFLCVACDQVTKVVAKDHLASLRPVSYMGNIFRLQYAENSGVFLSLGSALPAGFRYWVFTILIGIVLACMFVFILVRRSLHPLYLTGLSLIIAGGTGNLIDRTLNNGRVVDFMNIGVGSLRTGIFNIADVLIVAGMGILIIGYYKKTSPAMSSN